VRTRFVAAVVLACVPAAMVSAALAEEGVKAIDAAWANAMKTGDLEAVTACYAPDAVLWLPDAPEARGAKAIREAYVGFLGAWSVADVAFFNTVYQTSGDLSTAWGDFALTLEPKKGGDRVVMKGRFTAVAKKVGGRWLYVADHASTDPPPPAPTTTK
jgi:uncharacterized protein (TIGR02246 family)